MSRPATQPTSAELRRTILLHLRRSGRCATDAIAVSLGASRTGVAQQLRALESAGLVAKSPQHHGVGRPRNLYDVTPEAQGLFPSNYEGLAGGLLSAILEVGGERLMEDVFAARRRQAEATLRRRLEEALPSDATTAERVTVLARLQDEQGYLAEAIVDADGVRLVQHNCAMHDVARGLPVACAAELDLFRGLLGPGTIREQHIGSGDRCCTYRVGQAAQA
jgi:predicted ArsR family transcriptional regulator